MKDTKSIPLKKNREGGSLIFLLALTFKGYNKQALFKKYQEDLKKEYLKKYKLKKEVCERKNNSEGKKHKIKAAHTAFCFYVVKQRILTTLIEYFNRKKRLLKSLIKGHNP